MEGLKWDGELYGLRIGTDQRPHRQWLAGLALSWSEGRFNWTSEDEGVTGRFDLSLGGVWPYAGWVSADGGWRLWGLAGFGSGDAELAEDGVETGKSDLSMVGAALGASHELWRDGTDSGAVTVLRGKAEVSLTQMKLDASTMDSGLLEAVTVNAQRVRVGLEAGHERDLTAGRHLALSLSVGGRGDIGDSVSAALEIGPGLRYVDPSLSLTLEGRGHVLAVSGDSAQNWGLDLAARFDPRIRGRGPALSLTSGYGPKGGGAFGLWDREVAEVVASSSGGSAPEPRLEARMEYGLTAPPGLLTPYWGYAMANGGERGYRVGGRWETDGRLALDLQGERLEGAQTDEHRLSLAARIRF